MNENCSSRDDDEIEIDIFDMFFYLLKKWRGFIIALILGLLFGLGVYGIKYYQYSKNASINTESNDKFDENSYNIDKDVQAKMLMAYQYRQLYEKQLEYNENSIVMRLDPNKIYKGKIEYYISAADNTKLISAIYKSILDDENVLEDLQKASGYECDIQYIKELLAVSTVEEKAVSSTSMLENSVTKVNSTCIEFNVISDNDSSCKKMISVLESAIAEKKEEASEQYGAFDEVKIESTVMEVADSTYADAQRVSVEWQKNYAAAMKELEDTFGGEEKTYYAKKYLLNEKKEKESVEVMTAFSVNPVKWVVAGIIVMVIIWVCYYSITYMWDKKIKTTKELQKMYRLQVLGNFAYIKKDVKGIDKWIEYLHDKMKPAQNSMEHIAKLVETIGKDKIFVAGCMESEKVQAFSEKLNTMCDNICIGEFCSQSIEGLEKGKNVGKEIIIIDIGRTTHDEVERELEICKLQKIEILGTIILDSVI